MTSVPTVNQVVSAVFAGSGAPSFGVPFGTWPRACQLQAVRDAMELMSVPALMTPTELVSQDAIDRFNPADDAASGPDRVARIVVRLTGYDPDAETPPA